MKRAKLLSTIPPDRYKMLTEDGDPPRIGDVVELDQGTTGPDGQAMGYVYCVSENGTDRYEAKVYDYEIEITV